jgi:hypothetical protein
MLIKKDNMNRKLGKSGKFGWMEIVGENIKDLIKTNYLQYSDEKMKDCDIGKILIFMYVVPEPVVMLVPVSNIKRASGSMSRVSSAWLPKNTSLKKKLSE